MKVAAKRDSLCSSITELLSFLGVMVLLSWVAFTMKILSSRVCCRQMLFCYHFNLLNF